ncbi:hypothetical protein Taro_024930 [Colocasia esculenta]|uniref:Uncharacterized protein n=1 Tax=Colocasia esculenta TaxID=4460 RepID=A0A843VIZ5_COLES|nr:hypothetical protein [Colocasia esculenta]
MTIRLQLRIDGALASVDRRTQAENWVHLHLSTGALRLRTGFQEIEFLSVSVDRQFASVDRCTQE